MILHFAIWFQDNSFYGKTVSSQGVSEPSLRGLMLDVESSWTIELGFFFRLCEDHKMKVFNILRDCWKNVDSIDKIQLIRLKNVSVIFWINKYKFVVNLEKENCLLSLTIQYIGNANIRTYLGFNLLSNTWF